MSLPTIRWMALCCGLTILLTAVSTSGQSPSQYKALEKEIQELRQSQEALQKEVEELKSLLTPAEPPAPLALEDIVLNLDNAPIRGAATAQAVIVEVADFECPFCRRYMSETEPQILREYVLSGKVRYAFLNLPIASHRNAFKAAEAAACAGDEGKFWEMHDRLYANQPVFDPRSLGIYAVLEKLNSGSFTACLDTGKHVADINNDLLMVQTAGASATPTFFIGTVDPKSHKFTAMQKIVGAKPYETFKAAIDAVLSSINMR